MKNRISVLLRVHFVLSAVAVGMTANAYTNALTASYAAKIDRDIARGAELEAVKTIRLLEKSGDLEALPFFARVGLTTNVVANIRASAATAYVKIANLDESVSALQTNNSNKKQVV